MPDIVYGLRRDRNDLLLAGISTSLVQKDTFAALQISTDTYSQNEVIYTFSKKTLSLEDASASTVSYGYPTKLLSRFRDSERKPEYLYTRNIFFDQATASFNDA
jgi:hypothetical protein